MRCCWALAVGLVLWPSGVAAQETAAVRLSRVSWGASTPHARAALSRRASQFPIFLPPATWWEIFQEESQRVRAAYEQHPLERFHYVHNDRWHPIVFNFVNGYYSESSPFFRHWYSSAKGTTPLVLARGRLWLGVEFRRVLVFDADRRYSGPFPTPEPCYPFGRITSPLCYAMASHREGDRRYGITLRFNLGP